MATTTNQLNMHVVPVPSDASVEDLVVLQSALTEAPGSREKLRELLVRSPAWIERIGSLSADAERAVLESVKSQPIIEEAWRADLARKRAELTEPRDGALERLLVDRVALSWLAVTLAELNREALWKKGIPSERADFWDRHVSRLNGEFLRSSKMLATVRRLRLPELHVNVNQPRVVVTR